jgi:multiple sugar transport system ATP-binding protein
MTMRETAATEAADVDDTSVETGGDAVDLVGLVRRYADEVAVDGVSLSIKEGELFVLLGPSGCGKTTTLRMIAGLEPITDGRVEIGGVDISTTAPQNRDVAMVFQNYALYPHKTVEENIRFPLRKTDLSTDEQSERIGATAALLDIVDLLDKEPAALSGGQRQRVAIGRAIAREPSVLLMDEPLSNLDAKLRVSTRSELRDLQQRLGITTVYVTHDQEEAMSIADRIAIMNDGTVEQVGSPKEVYEEPTSRFVAGFLGDPPMNLFPARSPDEATLVGLLAASGPDDPATVGVRPEDLHLLDSGEPLDDDPPDDLLGPVECPLTVVEPTGRAYEVTLETDDGSVLVRERVLSDAVRTQDHARVAADPEAVYYFDEAGDRLREGDRW